MDRITQNNMTSFLESEQIDIDENNTSEQFELFASYCAIAQHYSDNYDFEDVITGEGCDSGIDAIAIIVNGTMITSKEEIDDLIEFNKYLNDINIVFIQAKTSSDFNYSQIGTFGAGVKDFFSEQPQMIRNDKVQYKHSIVSHIISNSKYIKHKPNCYLYYITTGKWVNDENCRGRMNIATSDLEELSLFSKIRYIPVDADLLQKYYRSTIDAIETEIDFNYKVTLPEIQNVKQSFLGYISHKEFLKLIMDENKEIRKNVFYDNVRDFQGDNPVNHEMAETVCNDPNKFIIFNNGVTVICKQLLNIGNKYTLTDYQIVNGCQTSHVLYNNKDNINNDLQIPIKLIETENEETVNRIIKATNRQTEVTNEQLIALNEFHRKLEAFYNTFPLKDRLYYERRSKQYNYGTDIEKVRIVSIGTQIKSVASMFYDKPHFASRFYGRLLDTIKELFDDRHQLWPYYTSAYTLYRLEYLFRNKSLPQKYRKFRFHILMMLKYQLVEEPKIPKMNSNKMESVCKTIIDVVSDNTKLVAEVKKIISLIDKHVSNLDNTETTKSSTLVDKLRSEMQN